ncbi:hypothetical protein BKA70DRAFT_1088213 [Coprinopsis sp. MPI-PUGE-AT-0042]|nr:hypothetical protein BKA70DRAFT_1088213 [Coprinopsis sp. MPI-PUGE-AT-0042]
MLDLPPEENEIIIGKLDNISSQIDALDKELQDATRLAIVTQSLMMVDNVSTAPRRHINGYWRALKKAEAIEDAEKFTRVMDSIGSDLPGGVAMTLSLLHDKLTSPVPPLTNASGIQVNKPLLENIRTLLQDRAVAEDRCYKYDIVAFRSDVAHWFSYVSDIQTKGIALAVMQENFRLVLARNNPSAYPKEKLEKLEKSIQGSIKDWKDVHAKRIAMYQAALVGGPLLYPATAILKAAAEVQKTQEHPKIWNLMTGTTQCCTLFNSKATKYGLKGGIATNFNLTNVWLFNQGFALMRVSNMNLFQLRTSRFEWAPEPFSVEEQSSDKPLHVKIIPRSSNDGEQPRVRLLLLNGACNGVDETIDVALRDPDIPNAIAFNPWPNPSDEVNKRMGGDGPFNRKRVLFWVNNLASSRHVLVFQAARANSSAVDIDLPANVWLPNERLPIGLSQRGPDADDLSATIRIRVYKLKDVYDATNKETVGAMLRLNPSNGSLDGLLVLDEGRADFQCDLFIRIDNPTGLFRNYVSVVTTDGGKNHPWGLNELCDGELEGWLNNKKVVQKESREFSERGLKLRYDISGSGRPDGSVDIWQA